MYLDFDQFQFASLKGSGPMILLALFSKALSALFSGLNLGLMCLDANQLQLLVKVSWMRGLDVFLACLQRWPTGNDRK